jgi:phenylpropionate dioxygenase-like ring-hydroxylating dioxygenase large terminal subunit
MDKAAEITLLKRLLHYLDTGTTAMADAPWRNEVRAYTCPERHRREEEMLFRKRPLVMGLSCDWPKAGAYRADDFAGIPVLTVRGSDGKLRAFLNACRHRGAKVAAGCGTAGAFTCPYHGWTYGNDGALRGIPEEATSFPGVRAERSGLVPLPLAEKYGVVWVLPTPATERGADLDIDPWLGGIEADLKHWRLDGYHFFDRHVHHEQMNWKLLVDTFHEGYHFGYLHKASLGGILVHNVGDFTPFGPNFRLVYGRTKLDRLRATPESSWDLMWNTTIVYSLFANTIFSPQGDHMEIFRVFPVDGRTDRALMETSLYIPKPAATEDEKRHWDANMELAVRVITTEDFPAGRTMQLGFESGAQSHVVYGRNEPALAHYHKAIRRELGLPVDEGPLTVRIAAE